MGLLESWDRRNQRTAEWQLYCGNEELRNGRSVSWRTVVALSAAALLLRYVLSYFFAIEWTLAILFAVVVGCFAVEIVRARRKRRAWEAARRRGPDKP